MHRLLPYLLTLTYLLTYLIFENCMIVKAVVCLFNSNNIADDDDAELSDC